MGLENQPLVFTCAWPWADGMFDKVGMDERMSQTGPQWRNQDPQTQAVTLLPMITIVYRLPQLYTQIRRVTHAKETGQKLLVRGKPLRSLLSWSACAATSPELARLARLD